MVKNGIFQEADFEVEARRGAQRLKKRLLVVAARYDQQADRGGELDSGAWKSRSGRSMRRALESATPSDLSEIAG